MKTPIIQLIDQLKFALAATKENSSEHTAYNVAIAHAEQMLEKEKEHIAYNSVRAIVEFQNNKNVELIEHPTELGSYHLRGEKEEVDKVLYGETFNTKER